MATATARQGRYGRWGGPRELFEAFISWSGDDEVQEALQEADARADFAEFLLGAMRTAMLKGYNQAAPQWDRYMGVEPAQDFREHRIKGVAGMAGIAHVGELGDYKEMRRAKRPTASYAVDTYGGVYSLTRHLIINDDTRELLSRTPRDMGEAMGRFVTRTAIALIESNPNAPDGAAMYSISRGNESANALSEDSLADMFGWMENQLDENGDEIVITPEVMAVKNLRMQLIAKRIVRSQDTGATVNYTAAAGVGSDKFDKGTMNPLAGILPEGSILRDPYYQDAQDYYLFADANRTPAFIMAFLDGNRNPFVGLKQPEVRGALPAAGDDPYTYEIDTLDFKVRHDFGAAVVDPRGTARGKPA
ncbi:MAG TPA: hypothetical protein VK631_10530 [Solirubrobacteraceae bacterium]|nr:hypothetical protein [Solirubrobacteraceae bacterium]